MFATYEIGVIVLLIKLSSAILVYETSFNLEETDLKSGLQYIPKANFSFDGDSFTLCARIKYKTLGSQAIFTIENPANSDPSFLRLSASYPNTWWGLGNYEKGNTSYSNGSSRTLKLVSFQSGGPICGITCV